jgi:D-alanyl-D-alanine carboxypeptidase (penicillin-binding protein 5/6)
MERSIEQPVEESSATSHTSKTAKLSGIVALMLLFVASGGLTFAYLSNIQSAPTPPIVQSASAVAATDPFASVSLIGKSAYVLDLTTGNILFSHNADIQLPLASLTKVMTILAISQVLPMDTVVTIPSDTPPSATASVLKAGSRWHLQDLINFTLIASSNEGAQILADTANPAIQAKYPGAPQENATLWRMNQLAQQLGLSKTYFLNPDGLDFSSTQSGAYGSARDVAALLAYVASTSLPVYEATTRDNMTITSLDGQKASAFNTDKALSAISGLVMGKTGYTDLAGGNLAVVFDVGPAHPIVAVVMNSTEDGRFSDMKQLVAAAQQSVAQIH